MIDLIVGLLILFFTTSAEEETPANRNNEEIIRPILMEDFHNDYQDLGE
jgi:hypothetical protein